MKRITDSERLTQAILDKREREIVQLKRNLNLKAKEIEAMQFYIEDLLRSRKILIDQLNQMIYFHKQNSHV